MVLIVVVCVLRKRQRNKALELPHEKGDGLDNPVYTGMYIEYNYKSIIVVYYVDSHARTHVYYTYMCISTCT